MVNLTIFTLFALAFLFQAIRAAPVNDLAPGVVEAKHEIATRDPNTALTRREADWQLELFQGGDWGCNGDLLYMQTTFPEFPENECVNLGAYTDSAYFGYAGPGLCATVYEDLSCTVPLWKVINVDQCYWGLPGQAIWISYNCPAISKRADETERSVDPADIVPLDQANLHPGLRLVYPNKTAAEPTNTEGADAAKDA
ncbi:MAG: hypothetical protein M1822_005101 [Bathelium mastoideum]|nr:MAG: hypothetical protein M1822_005101 [Bathelium mastoideum]